MTAHLDERPFETRRAARATRSERTLVWRVRHAAACLLVAGLAFNSSSGLTSPDTKIDLLVDPGRFLASTLHLWDADAFAGQLPNQAYGYLFPMGPFFWLGHAVGLPAWVVQRLWWSVLLCAAYLGTVALAKRLDIGSPWTRVLAGVAFACAPRMLTLVGTNSVELLPMCIAPWVVVPLVAGSRGADPRRCGLACGLAVLCMGGVNAAADFAAVLPAVLWLACQRPSRDSLRLTAWAVLGGALATLWWVVPLLLLAKYSPPFLDFIENANATTSSTALVEALRGTADWVAYVPGSGNRAGLLLLQQPVLIVDTAVVAAVGLTGVAWRRTPNRLWLVLCLAVGVVAVTFGHGAGIGSVAAAGERSLLDGVLAPLRNVHKFDVLIRLPIVLGMAHLVARIRWGRTVLDRRVAETIVSVTAVIVLIGGAAPMVALRLSASGSFRAIPDYWKQTAIWLGRHQSAGRALLLPSSAFADYRWGRTGDEPLQALAKSAWEVRNAIPLTPAAHVRMLDAVEQQVASGRGSPDLAAYLARNGVGYLVARNDLDYPITDAPPPAVVRAALSGSPGLRVTASFGPRVGTIGDSAAMVDQGLQQNYPAVQIWSVGSESPRVEVVSGAPDTVVSGGPEALLPTADTLTTRPTVLAGQSNVPAAHGVLADGMRRQELNPGGPAAQHSDTLTANDDGVLSRKALNFLPVEGIEHQSVARFIGAHDVTGSSSAADADNATVPDPGAQPYSAFDRDPQTAWRSALGSRAVGQWLQVAFDRPRSVGAVQISQPFGSNDAITGVTVTTDHGSAHSDLSNTATAAVPTGPAAYLRVTVDRVNEPRPYAQVAITELTIPGVVIDRTIVMPQDMPTDTRVDTISMSAQPSRANCVIDDAKPVCALGLDRAGEDVAGLDRTFTLASAATYDIAAEATPSPNNDLDALITRFADYPVRAVANTRELPDPLAGPQAAADGDPATGWIAAATSTKPTLTVSWHGARRIASLKILTLNSLAATRPDTMILSAAGVRQTVHVQADGTATFAPVTTDRLSMRLSSSVGLRANAFSTTSTQPVLGIGVSEVVIPGLTTSAPDRPVRLRCGQGPALQIDGRSVPTSLTTTTQYLRWLSPVALHPCGAARTSLAAGMHRVVFPSTSSWLATSVRLSRVGAEPPATTPVATSVTRWGPTSRVVHVAARERSTLLLVRENANPGWVASAGGKRLATVTVDGWQQGYLLPAGRAVDVHVGYTPQRTYQIGLIGGAVAVGLLIVLVLLPWRTRAAAELTMRPARWVCAGAGVAACLLAGGVGGLLCGLGVLAFAVALPRMVGSGHSRAAAVPAVAGGAMFVAGIELSFGPFGSAHYDANSVGVQLLSLIAIAAAAAGGPLRLRWRPARGARGRADATASPAVPPSDS